MAGSKGRVTVVLGQRRGLPCSLTIKSPTVPKLRLLKMQYRIYSGNLALEFLNVCVYGVCVCMGSHMYMGMYACVCICM